MASLSTLKQYLNYEFSSGCYTGEDYKKFQNQYINYLRSMCKKNGWTLTNVGRNHYEFSAFISKENEHFVYLSISDVRYFKNDWHNNILVRRALCEKDYRGDINNYTTLDRLEISIATLLDDLPF